MNKILLIHGYGIDRTAPFLFKSSGIDGGFTLFLDLVKNKQAVVYHWAIQKKYSFLQVLNPFELLKFYILERKKAAAPDTLKNLHALIQTEKPETVICHSMGCYLFDNYLQHYPLPNHIKKIIYIQGDVSQKSLEFNEPITQRLKNKSLEVIDLYCPWDINLITSMIINRYIPIGLWRPKTRSLVKSYLLPIAVLTGHATSIKKNKKLKSIVSLT